MSKLYYNGCTYCDCGRTTCEHPEGLEFLVYVKRCWKGGAVIDASDCPGFKQVKSRDDGKSEHELLLSGRVQQWFHAPLQARNSDLVM